MRTWILILFLWDHPIEVHPYRNPYTDLWACDIDGGIAAAAVQAVLKIDWADIAWQCKEVNP